MFISVRAFRFYAVCALLLPRWPLGVRPVGPARRPSPSNPNPHAQVAGTILAIAFSSKQGAALTSVQDLLDLWKNPAWIAYLAFVLVLAVALNVRAPHSVGLT